MRPDSFSFKYLRVSFCHGVRFEPFEDRNDESGSSDAPWEGLRAGTPPEPQLPSPRTSVGVSAVLET